jgi:hypothetical protein
VDAGVEQRLVAADVRTPGVAAEAELEVDLEPPLGRHVRRQLGALQEAAVEADRGRRLQLGQGERPGQVAARRLLDQAGDRRGGRQRRDPRVLGGRRRHHQGIDRTGLEQRLDVVVAT